MKKYLILLLLSVAGSFLSRAEQIDLRPIPGREAAVRQGASWGVPFAKGTVRPDATFILTDAAGHIVPSGS